MRRKKRKNGLSMVIIVFLILLLAVGTYIVLTEWIWGYDRPVSDLEKQWRNLTVSTAESWLGASERSGKYRSIIDIYNDKTSLPRGYSVQYDDDWCSTFVSTVSIQCNITEILPLECGCEPQINLFQELNAWQEDDSYVPLPGDVIFYHWDSNCTGDCTKWSDHVGIVVGTFGNWIKVIEGNYRDSVCHRYLPVDDPNIRGYGIPDYTNLAQNRGTPDNVSASALRNTSAGIRVAEYAAQHGLCYEDYPERLVNLLLTNPETETFVLEYPLKKDSVFTPDMSQYDRSHVPLFLQWDQQWGYLTYGSDVAGLTGCGPVSLSMAAWYLTGDPEMTPDHILKFATDNHYFVNGSGSTWTLISEGAVKLGFDVTEIPLDKDRIFRNLEVHNPIICVMGPGDFTSTGHFLVLAGCENGLIQINDPNSRANSEKLWSYEEIQDQILNLWVIRK